MIAFCPDIIRRRTLEFFGNLCHRNPLCGLESLKRNFNKQFVLAVYVDRMPKITRGDEVQWDDFYRWCRVIEKEILDPFQKLQMNFHTNGNGNY